jgi:hypothetical protein
MRKRAGPEMGLEAPVRSITEFIEGELERLEALSLPAQRSDGVLSRLNEVF